MISQMSKTNSTLVAGWVTVPEETLTAHTKRDGVNVYRRFVAPGFERATLLTPALVEGGVWRIEKSSMNPKNKLPNDGTFFDYVAANYFDGDGVITSLMEKMISIVDTPTAVEFWCKDWSVDDFIDVPKLIIIVAAMYHANAGIRNDDRLSVLFLVNRLRIKAFKQGRKDFDYHSKVIGRVWWYGPEFEGFDGEFNGHFSKMVIHELRLGVTNNDFRI